MKFDKLKSFFEGVIFGSLLFLLVKPMFIYYNKKQDFKKSLGYWKQIAQQQPAYPDSWAKLAIIWHNLDNQELSRQAIKKARKIDPIRQEFIDLEKKLK